MIVRYDGTDYHGFQKQPDGCSTVQAVLDQTLAGVLGPGRSIGASRTDAGVHAAGQVVVWRGTVAMPLEKVPVVLNRRLPPDIQIRAAFWVPKGWDPRRAASWKQYSYRLWRAPTPPPLSLYRRALWRPDALSWTRLNQAAALFLGRHDFQAFRTEGSSAETTVRTLLVSRWVMEEAGLVWRYQVLGNGFLYRMVRHLVGAMLEAAEPGGDMDRIRHGLAFPADKVGALAPPRGLTLEDIQFREPASGKG
ncbi:tRNA pseudouridine synthase A [Sulfobacillus harzensis]|nr:tRNA pseudouridine synthase A [Sulfobacillus harzensis]